MNTQLDRIEEKLDKLLEKKQTRGRKMIEYTRFFNVAWEDYPKRAGGNPKRKAFMAWTARLKELNLTGKLWGHDILIGVKRYADFCDATGKTGTEFVMQAATFFGPDKHFENDWLIPAESSIPKENNDLVAWAQKNGYRGPHIGEGYPQYRQALMSMHRPEQTP